MAEFLGQDAVGADGTAIVYVTHNLNGITWVVEQVSARTNRVSSSATVFILLNGNVVAPSAALTPLGTLGQATTAGGLPYVYLSATDQMTVHVQGATPGDQLTIRAQYRELLDSDAELRGR
jgi:hypothetical protein